MFGFGKEVLREKDGMHNARDIVVVASALNEEDGERWIRGSESSGDNTAGGTTFFSLSSTTL